VNTKTTGKIVRMIDKGVIVELPSEVDGFVPISHLAKPNLSKPADGYAVGDALELLVIEFNKDNKKIILSERLAKEPAGGEGGEGGKRKGKGKAKASVAEGEAPAPVDDAALAEAAAAFDEATKVPAPPGAPPAPSTTDPSTAN